VVDDIASISALHPIVIQTLLFKSKGKKPRRKKIEAWIDRLEEIIEKGGQIDMVQLHTVARPPAEKQVSPLKDRELDDIAMAVRLRIPEIAIETFYSPPTFTSE